MIFHKFLPNYTLCIPLRATELFKTVLANFTTMTLSTLPASFYSSSRKGLTLFNSFYVVTWVTALVIWLVFGYALTWPTDSIDWMFFTFYIWWLQTYMVSLRCTMDLGDTTRKTTDTLAESVNTTSNSITILQNTQTQYQANVNWVYKSINEELNGVQKRLNRMADPGSPKDVREFMRSQVELTANLTSRLNDAEAELRILRATSVPSKNHGRQSENIIRTLV